MASCRDTLFIPDSFFASLSQIPFDERGCLESQRSQAEAEANAITGRPALASVGDIGRVTLALYCVAITLDSTWNLR